MAPSTDNHSICQSPYMVSGKEEAQACCSLALSKSKVHCVYKGYQNSQGQGSLGQTSCPDSERDPDPLPPLLTLSPRSHPHLLQSLWNWKSSSVSLLGHLRVNFYLPPELSVSLEVWDQSVFQCPVDKSPPRLSASPVGSHPWDFCVKTADAYFLSHLGSWWSQEICLSGLRKMTGACWRAGLCDPESCKDGPDNSLCGAGWPPHCIAAQGPAGGLTLEEKAPNKLPTTVWECFWWWSLTWDILLLSLAQTGDRNLLTLHYCRANAKASLHHHDGAGKVT